MGYNAGQHGTTGRQQDRVITGKFLVEDNRENDRGLVRAGRTGRDARADQHRDTETVRITVRLSTA
jgi:hypothetical protein